MKILSIALLLFLSVGFTIACLLFRIFYFGSFIYTFFIWNLFLAAVPLLINVLLVKTKKNYLQWLLFMVWLLFFPNALYIITDLVHFKERYPVPLWYDNILVFSAAMNGLIIAY